MSQTWHNETGCMEIDHLVTSERECVFSSSEQPRLICAKHKIAALFWEGANDMELNRRVSIFLTPFKHHL